MAAEIYNHLTGSGSAKSAGTEVTEGKPLPPDVVTILTERGISMAQATRQQITKQMVNDADLIIRMTDKSLPDYLSQKEVRYWDIPDPRGLDIEAHRQTCNDIQRLVEVLIAETE